MLNSTRMWVLHHIRMRVFLWCAVHLWACVFGTLCYIMLLSKDECRSVFTAWFRTSATSPRVSTLWPLPFLDIKMSARGLAWAEDFSIGLRRVTRMRSGFQRNNNGLYCGSNSCFPLSPKKTLAIQGGTSCFVLTLPLLTDLNHLLSRLWALTFSTFCSCQASSGGWGQRKALCSLLGF